jgi:prolyl oligopeptidase
MYAYGGYNNAMPPSYHNFFVGLDIVDWVKEGNMYVNINIRGGNEYGEKWHTDGYKLKKKNCYYDFIGVSEGLIKDNYTKPENIAICGGSNGGLLMCALLTMRPDLWGCVIASVPHTDMISFAKDDRGPMYITEYGDPEDKEQFDYFLTYSPFHNIKKVNYPPIYIQTGECDNNVPPYHGKKMAARLQQYNTSDNPILLRVLEKGSHDRGKGEVFIQTISEMQTFIELALNKKF